MEPSIALDIDFNINQESVTTVEGAIDGLASYFEKAWSNAGDFTLDTLKTQTDALFTDIGKAWDKTTESWGSIAGDAIKDSLGPIFSGEMDDMGEIWDNAWDKMGERVVRSQPKDPASPLAPLRLAA